MTSPAPFSGKCVLVVEDETLIAMEIAAILEEAGAEVIGPASSIEQAQALLAAGASAPDAALLDINVAGASIDPVILALKDRGVPYACMTGYTAGDAAGLAVGVPVIRKPFPPEQIMAAVTALLER